MMPEKLDPSVLYIFVCGPGQGESTVIHVPPGEWIVVDSCRSSKKVFAAAILQKYGGTKACLVLTHRHQDHYRGLSALAEMSDWRTLGCNDRTLVDPNATEDGEKKIANELGQIFSLIRRRWQSDPSSEWKTWRRTKQFIGEGELLSLHPDETHAKAFEIKSSDDENVLSSAMVLRWNGNLFLLGADTPTPFWQEISGCFAAEFDLAEHLIAKIPHHGSLPSLDPAILNDGREQLWVVTPYNSSRLPKYDPGQGLEFLVNGNSEVHLTGLPVAQLKQPTSPCRTTLPQLRVNASPVPILMTIPGRVGVDVTPTKSELQNFYAIAVDATGIPNIFHSADGTVVVQKPVSSRGPVGVKT